MPIAMTQEQQAPQVSLRDWAKRADTIQVRRGIGFTGEHDARLYLRRALALRQLLGPAGGTTQILLNQIAQRVLGLPR